VNFTACPGIIEAALATNEVKLRAGAARMVPPTSNVLPTA
jgi:hypothetical protein